MNAPNHMLYFGDRAVTSALKNVIMLFKKSLNVRGLTKLSFLLLLAMVAVSTFAFPENPVSFLSDRTCSANDSIVPKTTLQNPFLRTEALIFIDGVEVSKERMEKLPPERIESISVLKDKAALGKYGEKGKNGVILIKTKKVQK